MNEPTHQKSRCKNPVFVMGLPRSGSTLLSRILNASPDVVSINDLYYVQYAQSLNAFSGPVEDQDCERLIDQILEVVNTRSSKNNDFIGQFEVSQSDIQKIRSDVMQEQYSGKLQWNEILDSTLTRVAETSGKTRWADKTPQNYFHFESLLEEFPEAKFIFLLRNPQAILSSFKFASGEGHDKRRYHPITYAMYWRSAARAYLSLKHHPNVMLVKYEDLLSRQEEITGSLGQFLETELFPLHLESIGHNSSFRQGERKYIRPTEAWMCDRICKSEMLELGYESSRKSFSLRDSYELIRLTAQFTLFQTKRALTDPDARQRMRVFLRQAT